MFYRVVIRSMLLYVVECWPIKSSHIQKVHIVEMKMLILMCGCSRHAIIIVIKSFEIRFEWLPWLEKLRETRLRWFVYFFRKGSDAPVRRCERLNINGRKRG